MMNILPTKHKAGRIHNNGKGGCCYYYFVQQTPTLCTFMLWTLARLTLKCKAGVSPGNEARNKSIFRFAPSEGQFKSLHLCF